MRLKVPYFKQDTTYTCGAASVQMVLRYFGVVESEARLAKLMHVDREYGTHHQAIIDELVAHGLFCYANNRSTLQEVHYFLEQKLPVLVHYLEPENNEGHYALIIGHSDGSLVLNDPWLGKGVTFSEEMFECRWRDEQHTHTRWLLVASPVDLALGHQYRPPA